jgi:catalase (peroxidase I)
MAVSIDNVYQKVLALANKEQRGYITPQEFNLFADQAQMEIFEQYFHDVDQLERRVSDDAAKLTKRKIEPFKRYFFSDGFNTTLPDDLYLVESSYLIRENDKHVTAEKLDRDGQHTIHASILSCPLLSPMKDYNLVQVAGQKEASTIQQEKQ